MPPCIHICDSNFLSKIVCLLYINAFVLVKKQQQQQQQSMRFVLFIHYPRLHLVNLHIMFQQGRVPSLAAKNFTIHLKEDSCSSNSFQLMVKIVSEIFFFSENSGNSYRLGYSSVFSLFPQSCFHDEVQINWRKLKYS